MSHIALNKYLAEEERKADRPRYDKINPMKVVLFAFWSMGISRPGRFESFAEQVHAFFGCWMERQFQATLQLSIPSRST